MAAKLADNSAFARAEADSSGDDELIVGVGGRLGRRVGSMNVSLIAVDDGAV